MQFYYNLSNTQNQGCPSKPITQQNRKTDLPWPDPIHSSIGYGSSLSKTDSDESSGECPPPKPELPDLTEKRTLMTTGFYPYPATFKSLPFKFDHVWPFFAQIRSDLAMFAQICLDLVMFGLNPMSFSSNPLKIQPNLSLLCSDPVKIYHHHRSIGSTELTDRLLEPDRT